MDVTIRPEEARDYASVENLTREAFWNVYSPGCSEHYIVHRGRGDAEFIPELSLVLELDERIVGHIVYFKSRIELDGGGSMSCLIFGPVSIDPAYQRRGLGKRLVDRSLELAAGMGYDCVCIEGDIAFYGKCGFVVAGGKGIRESGQPEGEVSNHFLLRELRCGALYGKTGRFVIPDVYNVSESEVEEFDSRFPPKTKLRLPGQLA